MNNTQRLLDAQRLAQEGDLWRAQEMVHEAVRQDRRDYEAWWALAQVASTERERLHAVQQVLRLRPEHPHAQLLLDQIEAGSAPPLDNVPSIGDVLGMNDKARSPRRSEALAPVNEPYSRLMTEPQGRRLQMEREPEAYPAKRKPQPVAQSVGLQVAMTVFLYWVMAPVGLVANLIFWRQAKQMEQQLGYQPQYAGCLSAMLVMATLGVLVMILAAGAFFTVVPTVVF